MPASPRTQRKRPADLTGVQMQRQTKDHAEELKERAKELGMLQQVIAEEKSEVVDLTGTAEPEPREAQVKPVEVARADRIIRVVCDIDQMTFGREVIPANEETGTLAHAGSLRMYSFEEGRSYKVNADLADHLEQLGYLY